MGIGQGGPPFYSNNTFGCGCTQTPCGCAPQGNLPPAALLPPDYELIMGPALKVLENSRDGSCITDKVFESKSSLDLIGLYTGYASSNPIVTTTPITLNFANVLDINFIYWEFIDPAQPPTVTGAVVDMTVTYDPLTGYPPATFYGLSTRYVSFCNSVTSISFVTAFTSPISLKLLVLGVVDV